MAATAETATTATCANGGRRPSSEQKKRGAARATARIYERRGKLQRQPCEDCGAASEHRHHENYDKPLEVTWLCRECHGKRHSKRRI